MNYIMIDMHCPEVSKRAIMSIPIDLDRVVDGQMAFIVDRNVLTYFGKLGETAN